jgi:hypothetical protein
MTLLIKGIVEICNSDQSIQNGLHDIVDVALHGSDGKVIDGDRDCTIVKKSQLFGFPLSLACRLGNHRFPAVFRPGTASKGYGHSFDEELKGIQRLLVDHRTFHQRLAKMQRN